MCATSHGEQIRGEAPLQAITSWLPEIPFDKMAEHSIDFWLQSEDLPEPENRIYYDGDRVVLDIHEGNLEAARRLRAKLEALNLPMGAFPKLIDRDLYLGKDIPTRRHRAPGRHLPLRDRSGHLGARPRLQGA